MTSRSRRFRSRTPIRGHAEHSGRFRDERTSHRGRKSSPDIRNNKGPLRHEEGRSRSNDRRAMRPEEHFKRSRRSRSAGRRSRSFERRSRFEPPEDDLQERRRIATPDRGKAHRQWREGDAHMKFSPPVSQRFSPEFQNFEMNPNISSDGWNAVRGGYEEGFILKNQPEFIQNVPAVLVGNPPQDFGQSTGRTSFNPDEEGGPIIPEFNPETSKLSSYEWIKLIEETAKQRDWKRDEKHYVLSSRLAGFARQWYLTTGIKIKTWGELRGAFFKAFPSEMEFCNLLQNMLARVKNDNETTTSYFQHKVALLNACEIHGRKAVSCIITGLQNAKLRQQAKIENCEDPDTLYIYLRSCGEDIKADAPKSKSKPTSSKGNKSQICYFCKKNGHIMAQCTQLKSHRCSTCFVYGHECEQYPKNDKDVANKNQAHGVGSQKSLLPKYFADVIINGISLRGYIDQTNDYTTIREENALFLKVPIRKQYKTIRGLNGSTVTSVGIMEAPIAIDRAIANVRLYVVPDHAQAFPVIVGQSFTEQSHIVLMKHDDRIRFYQRMDNGETNFDF